MLATHICLSCSMCLHFSPSAHLPVSQHAPSYISQCCQIARPHACQCLLASPSACLHLPRDFNCLPVLPDRRRHARAHPPKCSLFRVSVAIVGAEKCSLLAHKHAHSRHARVFLVGAQACPPSAHKSVSRWRSVFTVSAEKCSLLAQKRVHCRRTTVPVVSAEVCLAPPHKSAPCWRIIVSSVGAQKCSLWAQKHVHSRRTGVRCWRTHCSGVTSKRVHSRIKVCALSAQKCSFLARAQRAGQE